jgi:pyruvate/2-oxoglutarate dehydrogenase complex dihydrolipoamide dehydrogenase (E3) component
MLRSAEVMHLVARRAAEFGVEVDGDVSFRIDKAVARKDTIVRGIHKSIYGALDRRKSEIDLVRGHARFTDRHEIDTGDRRLTFENAIIATGARRVTPPIAGLGDIDYLDNNTALQLEALPSSMVIVGAGYIGIEFAQMYARFGVQVTMLGRNAHIAKGEDAELSDLLAGYLRDEGIDVLTNAAVRSVGKAGTGLVIAADVGGVERQVHAESLLVATGRVGNTDELDLAAAGLSTDDRGFLSVDEQLRTEQSHIWAIGDVKGGWMFTHVATYDGPIAALNAIKAAGKTVDYRVVPRAVFSDPTLAAVGLTEEEARSRGHNIKVGSVPMGGARAMAIGDTRGMLKAVVDESNGEILGFHVLAPHGDDLLHEAVAAMHGHGGIERISKSIHVHPTLSEMVKSAARAAK